MELGKTPVYCLSCRRRRATTTRQLCGKCNASPALREQFKNTRKRVVPDGEGIHAIIARAREAHPLWVPSPYPRDDPRFNALLAARVEAGLPEFHEDDPA
jgi:hypothetical protein